MPVILPKRTRLDEAEEGSLPLFDEDGGLTLAGEVVADFLEHADFDALFDHPAAQDYIITITDEDDEAFGEEVLPGAVALQLVDEDDLAQMFFHYLDILGENATGDDGSLQDKAKLAVFSQALGLEEAFKKGSFRKLRKTDPALVNRMLGAMLNKGEIKRSKPGKGYKGGDYTKGTRYKSGATKAAKKKQKAIRKKKGAAAERKKKQSRRGRRKLASLAASVGMEEHFVFGLGLPYGGALFSASADDDAIVEFDENELADLCARFDVFSLEEMKKGKKGMPAAFKKHMKGKDDDEDYDESVRIEEAGTFASAVGRPELSEGATLAAATMGRMGTLPRPAPVVESE